MIDALVAEDPVAHDGQDGEAERRRPCRQSVDPVGDIDGVRGAHHDQHGKDDPSHMSQIDPGHGDPGEGQGRRGVRPMEGQLGEEHGEEHLGQGFGPLVQPQTPLMADLDPVVQEADETEEDHRHDREIARAREPDLGAEVADDIADDDAA